VLKARFLFFLCCIGLTYAPGTRAQRIAWASQVLGVSSEVRLSRQSNEYRATQALGTPSRLPATGRTTAAWQPDSLSRAEEFLHVGFDTLTTVRQVLVGENVGPGALVKVLAFDERGTEHVLFQQTGAPPAAEGRLLRLTLDRPTPYAVRSVKLLFDKKRSRVPFQIDAVGISPDAGPVEARVNVSPQAPQAGTLAKENLGEAINSRYWELNPVIAPDGRSLFFTRWGHPQNVGVEEEQDLPDGGKLTMKTQDIWVSHFLDGRWQPAQNLGAPLNNGDQNSLCSISADGRTLLLLNEYLPNGRMTMGLSMSTRLRESWSMPRPVRIRNFVNRAGFAEFTMAPDQRTLIMAIQADDTRGGRDLYVSFRQPDSTWSAPRSLGPTLNTAENEQAPFLAADGKTLYFATRGLPGYGHDDIFLSRRLDSTWTRWSTPENLGPLINTAGADSYFSVPASGEYAYFTSRTEAIGETDIFRLKLATGLRPEPMVLVTGIILSTVDQKPIAAAVLGQTLPGGDTLRTQYDPTSGEFKLMLPLSKAYSLTAARAGYLGQSEYVDLRSDTRYREIRQNLYLTPIKTGTTVRLNSVFFAQSAYELLPASSAELDRIAGILRDRPTMEIQLEGHTDNLGEFEANVQLSQLRVEAVKRYLTGQGIDARRIRTKGWGPTRPVSNNYSEDNRKRNRRVEITVVRE
jgi:outer membrane protein OmpA-like peptidoglycan-associated protein